MLTVKEKGIMLYIIDYCKRIEEKAVGITRQTLDEDEDILEIACFNILQIGELAKKLETDFLKKYDKMPWNKIKGMRDVVAHGYGTINLDKVWKVISQEVEPLKEYCESILREDDNLIRKIKEGEKEDISSMSTYSSKKEF